MPDRKTGARSTRGDWEAIAIGGTKPGRGREPLRVQAQVLRDWQAESSPGSMSGFAFAAPEMAASDNEPGRKGSWRKSDLKRAIDVAQEAGLTVYRVEIAPDGTITIIVDSTAP